MWFIKSLTHLSVLHMHLVNNVRHNIRCSVRYSQMDKTATKGDSFTP